MLQKLRSFLVVFIIVLTAFTTAEYVAYGYRYPDSYTWLRGFFARLIGVFSGNPVVQDHSLNQRILGMLCCSPSSRSSIVSYLVVLDRNLLHCDLCDSHESVVDGMCFLC